MCTAPAPANKFISVCGFQEAIDELELEAIGELDSEAIGELDSEAKEELDSEAVAELDCAPRLRRRRRRRLRLVTRALGLLRPRAAGALLVRTCAVCRVEL